MGPRSNQLFYKLSNGRGATDASAHEHCSTIGGWWLDDPSGTKAEAIWFMEEADHRSTPWLLQDGKDYKRSNSALELLGTAMLLKILTARADHQDIMVQAPVKTDNEGNAYALLQSSSTSWPQSAILAEIAALPHKHGIVLRPSHEYREFNTWADDLTNLKTEGWSESKRVRLDIASPETWLVLLTILQTAGYKTALKDIEEGHSDTANPTPQLSTSSRDDHIRGEGVDKPHPTS